MNCKHGIEEFYCAYCLAQKSEQPQQRITKTVHGAGAVKIKEFKDHGFVSISNRKKHPSHAKLTPDTIRVHINGILFVWLLQRILELCPKVEEVRIIPSLKRKLSDTHYSIAKERGVKIIFGHINPELKWQEGESRRTQSYIQQQTFFETLTGEQKTLFDELLGFGFEAAQMVQDYFLIDHEQPMFLHDLCDKYGFSKKVDGLTSAMIHAVMHYLDSSFETSLTAEDYARRMTRNVLKIRRYFKDVKHKENLSKSMCLEKLPDDFPLARISDLENIMQAKKDGRLSRLKTQHPNLHLVIIQRFGLENLPKVSQFRTLQQIADLDTTKFGTRERARQLEEKAFSYLGI